MIQYRKAFIDRLLAGGEEAAEKTAADYQREAAEKDRDYDSTASALKGKRELNDDETARLKQLWKKLVRMFHPDLHEQDPEKRKTYERLTQAINEARDRGDIELLERIAKDPQAFIRQQGWASVSLDGDHTLMELRSLYEHLQARILELIEPSSLKLRRAENPRHPPRQPGLRSLPVRRERRRRDRHHRRRAAGGVGERN